MTTTKPRRHEANYKGLLRVFVFSWLKHCFAWMLLLRGHAGRPDGTLGFTHRAHAFKCELLDPLSLVRLRRIQVAFRVGGDAVHGVELAGLPSAIAEARQLGHRRAIEHMDFLVGAIGEEEVLLLWIFREGDVPRRAVAERVL